MNIARTIFQFSVILPVVTSIIACGGVDEDPGDGNPDLSSISSCMQDSWTRTIPGNNGGSIQLTYEFLENGTYIQRSNVDNISTAEYFGGIRNTNLDLDVLPGLSIDLGTALGILGPFYTEGYFYTEGSWEVEESSGVITTTLPKNAFGHSIWSASSAKRDFDRETSSQMTSKTIEQYVYCKSDRLVVGAFYKEDDSDIAGLWDNLDTEFYVSDDYVGASQRFRAEDGDIYASNSFAMELQSEGYALRRCSAGGEIRGGNNASFYKVTSDNTIVPTGGLLPAKVDVNKDYYEMLSDAFYYRLDVGLLSRVNTNNGDVTELLNLDEGIKARTHVKVQGGVVAVVYKVGDEYDTLFYISDTSDEVVQLRLERGVFSGPWSDGELVFLSNRETGAIHQLDFNTGALVVVPFDGAPTVSASGTNVFLVEGELIVRSISGDLHQYWTYSDTAQQLELLGAVSDVGGSYSKIFAGDGGFDVVITRSSSSTLPGRIVHLSEADDYAQTAEVSLEAESIEPKGDGSSRFFVLKTDSSGDYQLYLMDVFTNDMTLVSQPGNKANRIFTKNDDGSRVIYALGGWFDSEPGQMVVINITDAGLVSRQVIDTGRSTDEDSAHLGDASAFYVTAYTEEGDSYGRLFSASGSGAPMTLVTDELTFRDRSAGNGYDFIVSDHHLLAQARDEYSARELMLFNQLTQEFEFHDLNTVPDVSSSPRLLGTIGGETLISAWNLENSCHTPEGLLKFEENYLWYESDIRGFPGTQWFER